MDHIAHQRVQRLVKGRQSKASKKKKSDNSLKVVYISSPMKVRTSASRFRSLVQQLTGKHSDVARYMESIDTTRGSDFHEIVDCENQGLLAKEVTTTIISDGNQVLSSSTSSPETSEDSPLGSMDNALITSQMEEEFAWIFSCDPNVLGSYDELL